MILSKDKTNWINFIICGMEFNRTSFISYRVVRIIIEVSVIWTENHFTYEYLYR